MHVSEGGERVQVAFKIPEGGGAGGATFMADIMGRRPWNAARPNSAEGPEGWLSHTGMLPCHYAVQSLSSQAKYKLEIPGVVRSKSRSEITQSERLLNGKGRTYRK